MPQQGWLILLGISVFFILFGLIAVILGKVREKSYYNSITDRLDVREFLEHSPEHPEPGALRVGGWIAIAVGLVMIAVGVIFRLAA